LALTEKAQKVGDFYASQNAENFTFERKFTDKDFDFNNEQLVASLERTDGNGNLFVKSLPVSEIACKIMRNGKDSFTVTSTATTVETNRGVDFEQSKTENVTVSFSNKRKALSEIAKLYESQGVSSDIAKKMAREVFAKAQAQSAENVSQNMEVKAEEQFRNSEKVAENARENTSESARTDETAKNVAEDVQSAKNEEYADMTAEFENEEQSETVEKEESNSEIAKNSENSKEITLERNGHEKNAEAIGSELNPKTSDFANTNADIPEMPAPKRGRR
jgi:hypothetical protein